MSLHAKFVISLQQFFHLSQIKAKDFSPLLNNKEKTLKQFIETIHVNVVIYHFNRKTT